MVSIGGVLYEFKPEHIFSDETKATAVFLKLKMYEMQNDGSYRFRKKTFQRLLTEYEKIIDVFPEYVI